MNSDRTRVLIIAGGYCWALVDVGAPLVLLPPIRLFPYETICPPGRKQPFAIGGYYQIADPHPRPR